MIGLSGKFSDAGRAYVLIIPEIPGERPADSKFGFLPTLAKYLLSIKGLESKNADEIHAMSEALLDPGIDPWGCKLVSAEHRIAYEYAWVSDIDDVAIYCDENFTDEYQIRSAVARITDRSVLHAMIDALVELDRDLDMPGFVKQVHKQIDE
jgi:hypothetical protein